MCTVLCQVCGMCNNDYDTSTALQASSPVWTKHTLGLFFHSSDINEHEDHVPKIVLVTGGTSVTILPNSLNHNKT